MNKSIFGLHLAYHLAMKGFGGAEINGTEATNLKDL